LAAASTLRRVLSDTLAPEVKVLDTAERDTLASLATSARVTGIRLFSTTRMLNITIKNNIVQAISHNKKV
jgi:hypothetical protein